jgi:hypothetical protein
LARDTGHQVDEDAPSCWRWLGHRVLDVDGSTVTMADTKANQAEYPQQPGQKRGCGFPIARIVVVFSLAVGAVLDAALGPYQGKQTGENSLFRTLHDLLRAGDVVLADRYFSGWFDLALLWQRAVHSVVRKHQLRPTDFRTGRRLSHNDQLVCWAKPQRPAWMSREDYAALPAALTLRKCPSRNKRERIPHLGWSWSPPCWTRTTIPRQNSQALPAPLASGTPSPQSQDRSQDGSFTLQDTAPCS